MMKKYWVHKTQLWLKADLIIDAFSFEVLKSNLNNYDEGDIVPFELLLLCMTMDDTNLLAIDRRYEIESIYLKVFNRE